jgi:hypothetical protein
MSIIRKNPEIRAMNQAAIAEIARRVPDGILAIHGMGERRRELPLPKKSEWHRRLHYKQEKARILLLLPCLAEGDADAFNLDIVSRVDPEKYEFSIITTQPYSQESSRKQMFEQYVTDIFDLAQFLSVDDYAEFIHYFIKSRGIDIILLSNTQYGYNLLPWLRLIFPGTVFVDCLHPEPADLLRASSLYGDVIENAISGHVALFCHREYPAKYEPPLFKQ